MLPDPPSLTSHTLSSNVAHMTEQAAPNREILTIKETAELTGISIRTWRFWRTNGETATPRSFKLGRAIYYKRADVEAWIEAKYAEGR